MTVVEDRSGERSVEGGGQGLDHLLSPVSPDDFFADHYERRWLHLTDRDPGTAYPAFPDLAEFEQILWRHEDRLRKVLRLNRAGKYRPLPPASSGKGVFRWALESFDEGFTLILNGVDHLSTPIARLARAIETETRGRVAANAFLTPPENKGFLPHFDTHDVFILQLEGTKIWRLYDSRIDLPVDRQIHLIDQDSIDEPEMEAELLPGDLLYVPRGVVHGSFTGPQPSLHLTMGYRPLRWSDYFAALVEVVVETETDLRRSVRPRSEVFDEDTTMQRLELIVDAARSRRVRRLALERFEEGMVGELRELPGNHLSSLMNADSIDGESLVRRRPDAICHVYEVGSTVRIQFPGIGIVGDRDDLQPGSIEAPLTAGGALRFIADAESEFSAKDLPNALSLDSRVKLIRMLAREGLLEIVSTDRA